MPNHCANRITISGPQDEIDKCREAIRSHDSVFELKAFFPMPEELKDTKSPSDDTPESRALRKKYGYSDWYGWSCANWGTKWGTYDCHVTSDDKGKVSIRYQTAWSPLSIAVFEKLSGMFPKLKFEEDFAERGMAFAGTRVYQEGEQVEDFGVDSKDESVWAKVNYNTGEPATAEEIREGEYESNWVGDKKYAELFAHSG